MFRMHQSGLSSFTLHGWRCGSLTLLAQRRERENNNTLNKPLTILHLSPPTHTFICGSNFSLHLTDHPQQNRVTTTGVSKTIYYQNFWIACCFYFSLLINHSQWHQEIGKKCRKTCLMQKKARLRTLTWHVVFGIFMTLCIVKDHCCGVVLLVLNYTLGYKQAETSAFSELIVNSL